MSLPASKSSFQLLLSLPLSLRPVVFTHLFLSSNN
jgi:hypothetical protein